MIVSLLGKWNDHRRNLPYLRILVPSERDLNPDMCVLLDRTRTYQHNMCTCTHIVMHDHAFM